MFNWLRNKMFSSSNRQSSYRRPSQFIDVGFHGDEYLLSLVGHLASTSKVFVETGANVGSTLAYVARNYSALRCLSCEPDRSAFEQAIVNVGEYGNVALVNGTSQQFIDHLEKHEPWIFSEECFFWLDAHGYG